MERIYQLLDQEKYVEAIAQLDKTLETSKNKRVSQDLLYQMAMTRCYCYTFSGHLAEARIGYGENKTPTNFNMRFLPYLDCLQLFCENKFPQEIKTIPRSEVENVQNIQVAAGLYNRRLENIDLHLKSSAKPSFVEREDLIISLYNGFVKVVN